MSLKIPMFSFARLLALGGSLLCLAACGQASNMVEIRYHGTYLYKEAEVSETAKKQWEYAVMSYDVYEDQIPFGLTLPQMIERACSQTPVARLPLPGWTKWQNFPKHGSDLGDNSNEQDLYFEVWQNNSEPPIVAIAFKGTVAKNLQDWLSNLRWFIPWHHDQYTVAAGLLAQAFADEIFKRIKEGSLNPNVNLIATGHSLGGGLAQQLAYAFDYSPAAKKEYLESNSGRSLPRITKVYAFDPSPVTGYFTVDAALRDANSEHLTTARIFEHGEILAYIRLLLGYVFPPSAHSPEIDQYRYNFNLSLNPFANHEMSTLACGLAKAANPLGPTK